MMEQQRKVTAEQSGGASPEPASERGGFADAAYLASVAARSAGARQDGAQVVRDGIMGA